MNLRITIDTESAKRYLKGVARDQFPFAVASALNRTAEEAQARGRQLIHQRLTVAPGSPTRFMESLVRIRPSDKATKERLMTRIRIEGPEGSEKRAEILTRHIRGGTHTRSDPMSPFFLPGQDLYEGRYGVPARRLYPKNLRLEERRDITGTLPIKSRLTTKGKTQFQGKYRTFMLHPSFNAGITQRTWGIYQRTGPKKDDIRLLWALRPVIQIRANYPFYGTLVPLIRERFAVNFNGMMAHAIRTAR